MAVCTQQIITCPKSKKKETLEHVVTDVQNIFNFEHFAGINLANNSLSKVKKRNTTKV